MAAKIFCCYARKDQELLNELKAHLMPLQRQGLISIWADTDINAGSEWEKEIEKHLNTAQIILLLVSPDFINSDYCYSKEMKRALERHEQGEAHVIPIILRPIHWKDAPFGKLQALPTDGKPITDPYWHSLDMAFFNVAGGIRKVVIELSKSPATPLQTRANEQARPQQEALEQKRYTRRAVLAGLAGLAGGGIALFAVFHPPPHPIPTPTPTTSPATPTPTPPLGTLLYTYRGHSSYVFAVAWSPDGKRIASGSNDQTVQVWEATTGANVYTYRGHSYVVGAVVWSPNGKRIASGSWDKTVQVWDAANGGNVYTYRGHSSYVLSVAWSPDGKRIASGSGSITSPSSDHTVQVWDASSGHALLTYTGPTAEVLSVAWSPDGKRIASGSADHTVQVWDAANGGNVYAYRGHSGPVNAVAWSPDGRRIASASLDVQVWDAADGGHVYIYRGHSGPVIAVTWSPDGKRIASGGGDITVQVWVAG